MQTLANSYTGINLFEVRDNSTLHGYTKRSFPGIVVDDCYLTVTYYDDYLYKDQPSVNFDNSWKIDSYRLSESVKYNQAVLGQVTGAKVKVLKDGAATWLRSAIYYDDRYRTIQTVRETYPSGLEYTSSRYSFNNSIAETKTYQSYGGVTMDNVYSYDHAWRPLKTVQTISKGGVTKVETLAEQEYNEVGQLKSKRLSGGAQQLDYAYNIRGWLTAINNTGSASSSVRQFSLSLRYNDSSMGVLPQFNGNISSISWRMPGGTGAIANGAQQSYSFTYDALNRLRNCHYSEGSTGSLTNEGYYDESIGSYDLNGNILSLSRKKAGVERDALTYTYEGNRLVAVNDAADDNALFTEKCQSGIEYTYDVNGNMITDLNKGVSVAYNVLNLPKQVVSGSDFASYIYDASGNKLAQMTRSGSARDTLYYSGAFVYNDTKLDYALTGEGRVVYTNGLFSYEYFLKDHLGSTRVATAANGTVNTSTFYYPFGLSLKEINNQGDNHYLFNDKELQDVSLGGVELGWVDYGARFYDPQISRWSVSDPMAELDYNFSTYNYCLNNPVNLLDPSGLSTHTDSTGVVVAVYNDNNNKVYKHKDLANNYATYEGETETYTDPETGETCTREKSRLTGGESVGETENWDEFRSHDDETGKTLNKVEGKIAFGESWDYAIDLYNRDSNKKGLSDVAVNSLSSGTYDLKTKRSLLEQGGASTGKLLNGKYATARSAGNYLAGLNGATGKFMGSYISLGTYMRLAGQVHSPLNFRGAPYYGEIPYAGRMIVAGFNAGINKRK